MFDGAQLPGKSEAHKARQKRRDIERLNSSQQSVHVTEEMARNVIQRVKMLGIKFVVAPFEADAQLAWLLKNG